MFNGIIYNVGKVVRIDKRSKGIDFDATNVEGILNDLVYRIHKD